MKIIAAPPVPYEMKRLNLLGILAIVFGVFGFFLWSVLTPIDSAVVAPGSVQVVSQNKQIQHLEGGIVEAIYVKDNQLVQAGDVLLSLDETFAGAEHHRLVMQSYELEIREAMLTAERDMQPEIQFPQISDESLDELWLSEQTETATRLFELGRGNLTNQLAITDKRLSQLKQQAKGLKKEHAAKVRQLGFMQEEIESWKGMVEKKLANKLRFLQIQSEAAELNGVIAQVEAQEAEVQVKVGEVELERLQAQQMYQEKAAKELRDIQFSLKDIRERLATSENILGRVAIRSPVSGTVTGLKVHTIGAVVKPGDLVMEIVPDQDKLIVETRVSPTDIDQVYQGMSARIRISAYKRHELPELEGHIESISADSFEDERAQSHYYLARISIDRFVPDGKTGLQEPTANMSAIQPGMPSEVMIITGESTPAQYLMDPLLNAFNRAWRDS